MLRVKHSTAASAQPGSGPALTSWGRGNGRRPPEPEQEHGSLPGVCGASCLPVNIYSPAEQFGAVYPPLPLGQALKYWG